MITPIKKSLFKIMIEFPVPATWTDKSSTIFNSKTIWRIYACIYSVQFKKALPPYRQFNEVADGATAHRADP